MCASVCHGEPAGSACFFIITNVGLWTAPENPKVAASAWVKAVFPAPSSPESATTAATARGSAASRPRTSRAMSHIPIGEATVNTFVSIDGCIASTKRIAPRFVVNRGAKLQRGVSC